MHGSLAGCVLYSVNCSGGEVETDWYNSRTKRAIVSGRASISTTWAHASMLTSHAGNASDDLLYVPTSTMNRLWRGHRPLGLSNRAHETCFLPARTRASAPNTMDQHTQRSNVCWRQFQDFLFLIGSEKRRRRSLGTAHRLYLPPRNTVALRQGCSLRPSPIKRLLRFVLAKGESITAKL